MSMISRLATGVLNNPIGVQLRVGAVRPAPSARRQSFHTSPSLWLGATMVGLFLLIALVGPFVTTYAPDQVMAGARLAPPSPAFPFGTDSLGRDILSRVLYGARLAVWTMLLGTSIAVVLGILPGLVAGYRGGWIDQVLSRGMDIALAFPGMLLALIVVARLGPSLDHAVIAMGMVSAPGFFRLVRVQTISGRTTAYVDAARSIGASDLRILFRHIAPNLLSSMIVIATTRAGILLLAIGGLSFVGLGAQPPAPEWGALLASGRGYLETAPWVVLFPGVFFILTIVSVNLLGDGLRDALDPHARA